ncbi:MAG: helix-turn-helix transcriptional regulator [Ktedonobacteraceae bacterium]|nr:helix-turn-helix transcriptional regulator [Ktedonobacteraceae bacterium]
MALASVLKEYRHRYNLTQQQLAENLSIDERTLRRWENQETVLNDMCELRRISAALGVDAEKLGVADKVVVMTDELAGETLQLAWKLIKGGRVYEARAIAERLVKDLQTNALHPGSYQHLCRLTHAHHAAAYVKAMNTRNSEIQYPLASYAEMEKTARMINDATLLTIALSYEGDMHTRKGAGDCFQKCIQMCAF